MIQAAASHGINGLAIGVAVMVIALVLGIYAGLAKAARRVRHPLRRKP